MYNNKMKRVAVIGANAPLEPFYKQARKLGYYIIGIAWNTDAVCKKYCDKFLFSMSLHCILAY